jgi:hypothetical protein
MVTIILKSLYFFLPALLAYLAAHLTKLAWKKPIWKKLGDHTWIGLGTAVIVGILIFWIQKMIHVEGSSIAIIDYADFTIIYGLLLGLGTVLGDLIKDFFKLRTKFSHWWFWDETAFIFGSLILGFFVYVPAAAVTGIILIAGFILHLGITFAVGYIKKR